MKNLLIKSALALIAILLVPNSSKADRRIFGFTYPYQTLPEGSRELEHYLDMKINDWDNPNTTAKEDEWTEVDWKHQIEFEYGITDHLDFGFYGHRICRLAVCLVESLNGSSRSANAEVLHPLRLILSSFLVR